MLTDRSWPVAVTIAALSPLLTLAQSSAQASDQAKTTSRAVSYVMGSTSRVDLRPGTLSPQASGEAEVQAKQGVTNIKVSVENLVEPTSLGAEFLTYVVWVVSPDGRASNVGEIELDQSRKGRLKATTP